MIFKVFDPSTEISGNAIKTYSKAIEKTYVDTVLDSYGIDTIDPEAWYPLQIWLDVLNEIHLNLSSMSYFVTIGMSIAEALPFPEHFNDLPLLDVLQLAPQGYTIDHRGDDIGSIDTEQIDERSLRFIVRTPYPDDFFYGVCYGLAQRFAGPDQMFTVQYDNSMPRRDLGGQQTVIEIRW